jgi:hypothetical protein
MAALFQVFENSIVASDLTVFACVGERLKSL